MTGEDRRRRDGGRGSRGRLTGVGVGPGDPDLVTVKGVKVLTSADAVFVPVGERGDTGWRSGSCWPMSPATGCAG